MKKIVSLIICAAFLFSMTVTSFAALSYGSEWDGYYHDATTTYADVPSSHWAYNAIMRSTEKNWFGGYPDGTFRPDGPIKRAEALKVFVVFLGLELEDVTESTFYDVDPNKWYAPYIEAGKDLFPTHTTNQGKTPFNPEMPVTREDTIYALVKALGYNVGVKYVDESILNMFSDKNSISGDIRPYFAIALQNELVSGFPDGTIRAQDSLTRAEFATLLYRGSFVGFNDAYEAIIDSVTVTPTTSIEMTVGETITLSARATYTDKTNKPYTELSPYDANGNGVITLKGTTITAVKEGTAVIKYNDSYLKKESLTITVKNPTEGPSLKVTDYDDITKESTMEIKGRVTDKNGDVDLTCNGKDVAVKSDGSFAVTVSLVIGTNNIQFVAENIYGVETTKSVTIIREKEETTSTTVPDTDSDGDEKEEKEEKEDKEETVSAPTTPSSGEEGTPYLTFDKSTGTITKCGTSVADIEIPDKIEGVNVHIIGEGAFEGCTYLESITFPSTLKTIKASAFSRCTHLLEVKIPEGTTSIGANAFDGCVYLTDAVIPEGIKKIADELFIGCKRLKNISLPETVKEIGANAFEGCKSLEEVVLPESTTTIKDGAFKNCGGLQKIVIPDNVTTIADDAFDGCNALTIYASVSSYAIEYAKENGIAWAIL
ncbi:MAG: leucine-rich repeat protein [Clostridia bacterium]